MKEPESNPSGRLFSQLYINRSGLERDSERFRRRLAAYFEAHYDREREKTIARHINLYLGVEIPIDSIGGPNFSKFFLRAELRDVLDAITLFWRLLKIQYHESADYWISFVRRAMKEEYLGYTVDDQGGVHLFVDPEYAQNTGSTIEALTDARYGAVVGEFKAALQKLDEIPPDAKGAITSTFEAVETLAKLIDGRIARLGSTEVEKRLRPVVGAVYADDVIAQIAANQFLTGFSDWINAAHQYRHGQAVEEPNQPPLDLAVAMVSAGATYLRWLADIHNRSDGEGEQEKVDVSSP